MALKATIVPPQQLVGTVGTGGKPVQATSLAVSGGIAMSDLSDVDLENPVTGAVMTYDATEGKFKVVTDLASPNTRFIGGNF